MKAIIYEGKRNAKRIKFHIPFQAVEWRQQVKQLNKSFYHPNQKLWSIVNTKDALKVLEIIFNKQVEFSEMAPAKSLPYKQLSDDSIILLGRYEQKIILKGYSSSTLKNY